MKYVFSKEKYIEKEGTTVYEKNKYLVDKCDKKTVILNENGFGSMQGVHEFEIFENVGRAVQEWCEVVEWVLM